MVLKLSKGQVAVPWPGCLLNCDINNLGSKLFVLYVVAHTYCPAAQIQMVLKLSKEKWEEAAAHAAQAVQSDFRRRVWYPPAAAATVGLVYGCKYGAVQLKDPVCECRSYGARGRLGDAVPASRRAVACRADTYVT